MFPRALRALLEGARTPPGREEGVVLSSYRANPPESDPQQTELREADALFSAAPQRYGAPHGRLLRAAPLPRLTQHLLESSKMGDGAFVPTFLSTFRAFARPHDVLRLLLARMEELGGLSRDPDTPAAAEAKRALAELLPRWLQDYPEDFGDAAAVGLAERLGAALGPDAAVGQRLRELRDPTVPPDPPGDPYGDGDGDADPLEILSFQAQEVAEQLTLTEAELFLRLRPYECLGSLWSQRDKKGRHGGCPSVRATVRHFNRVAAAVVTSCLGGAGLRPPQRARLLEKWIRVAQECRALRNFSSLCAIISALQSNPIHRLRHSWGEISRDAQRSYEELSALCSEQNNFSASRRLLLDAPQDPPPRRQPHGAAEQRPMGVVPYLGTFLRDLVMLDAAMKDEVEDGWINFEKRRKEFEVLAQLSALQSSCRSYRLQPQPHFQRWLWGLRVLPEGHSHTLSCAIEPPGPPPLSPRPPRPTLVITHCTDPLPPEVTPTVPWEQPCPAALLGAPPRETPTLAQRPKWPSVSSLDAPPPPAAPPAPPPAPSLSPPRCHRRSASCGAALSPSGSDCRIVRVRMELHNGSLYKSILITSQEKTPAVVTKALEKHGQGGGSAPQFQLVQLLPDHRAQIHFTSGCNHPSFTLPWRTLLPYLVALHLLQLGSAQLTVVAPSLRVTANVGQDVVLRCHLCPCKDAWRLDIRWIQQRSSGFVHHYQDGEDLEQMEEYKGRTELLRDGLSDGNLDLRITAVSSSDSGSYSCAVQDGDAYAEAVVNLEVSDPFSQIVHPWKVALAVIVTLLVGSFVIIAFLYRKKAAQSRELMDQAAALERKDAELVELDEISGLSAESLKQLASKLNENADEVEHCNLDLKKDCEEMRSGVADLKKLARELEENSTVIWTWDVMLKVLAAKLGHKAKELEKQHLQFYRHFQHMYSSAGKQKELVTKLEEHCEQMERRNAKLEIPAVKVGQQAKESEKQKSELKERHEEMGQQAKESEKQKSELKERHEEMAEQTEAVVVETEH